MPWAVSRSTRSARAAAAAECVTSKQAAPAPLTCSRSTASTRAAVSGSRLPVGSSARISPGACTTARAMATRCSCPPDNCAGKRPPSPSRPTSASNFRTRCASGRPSKRSGNSTFSATVKCGSTWKAWNTKPSRARRSRAQPSSPSVSSAVPSMNTCPRSARSSPAMQFSSVDLPTPDSPNNAINSPLRSTSDTASKTGVLPKDLPRLSMCSMCAG